MISQYRSARDADSFARHLSARIEGSATKAELKEVSGFHIGTFESRAGQVVPKFTFLRNAADFTDGVYVESEEHEVEVAGAQCREPDLARDTCYARGGEGRCVLDPAMRFVAFFLSGAAGSVGLVWTLPALLDVTQSSVKIVGMPQPCIECPSNELPVAIFIAIVIAAIAAVMALAGGALSLLRVRAAPLVLAGSGCGTLIGLVASGYLVVLIFPQAFVLFLAAALASRTVPSKESGVDV